MNHPASVKGWHGSLQELAFYISIMRYDALCEFINYLAEEIKVQAKNDKQDGKIKLSRRLAKASTKLFGSGLYIKKAWKICKPFMKKELYDYQKQIV